MPFTLRYRRIVAVFLLLNVLVSVFPPQLWALTSGPTAPEATSFEPVDTTDVVSLATGDFTYNIPLLEVPGPAGSYPLSLSYHGGILPGEDASWVGLGWTINPGSITRMVNGYADDFSEVGSTDRSFSEGGNSSTVSIGVSIGIGEAATVSAGLDISHDTYRGYGVGGYLGGQIGFNMGELQAGVSARVGLSPYGGISASAGVNIGFNIDMAKGLQSSPSIGLNVSKEGVSPGFSAGVGLAKARVEKPGMQNIAGGSLLDVSLGSGSSKPSLSIGGGSVGVFNSKAGSISTHSNNFQVDIPVWYGVNIHLGRSYVRYWSDETETDYLYGSLYSDYRGIELLDNRAWDTYSTLDPATPPGDYNSDELPTITFPDYDYYNVTAQGVSGSMRPYHYFTTLKRQNQKHLDGDNTIYTVKMYDYDDTPIYPTNKVEYHFENEFVNKVVGTAQTPKPAVPGDPAGQPFTYKAYTATTGNSDGHTIPNVPGGKHIEWFSVSDVADIDGMYDKRFLKSNARGLTYGATEGTVAGFKITNASGVSYHFALPAYEYEEYTYSGNKDDGSGSTFNLLKSPSRYAYTWYLTSVTGPDFIDRNHNAVADDADWGYWVNFNYGMWADDYNWRTPGEGFNEDIDSKFQGFSMGKKELYFLNSITTATHSAIFEKEIRNDGKGVTLKWPDGAAPNASHYLDYVDTGGYDSKVQTGTGATVYPVSQMKLNAIYVLKNEDVPSSLWSKGARYRLPASPKMHYGDNVIEDSDLAVSPIVDDAIRVIRFETDYSLAPGTPNSYKSYYDGLNTEDPTPGLIKTGKLTLNKLQFLGKGGVGTLPKTSFSYDYTNERDYNGDIQISSDYRTVDIDVRQPGNMPFVKGDFVSFEDEAGATYYGVIIKMPGGAAMTVQFLDGVVAQYFNGTVARGIKRSKNPPYSKDATDMWSYFKSDYTKAGNLSFNEAHATTEISAKNIDAWSLRSVQTPVGSRIDIDYESDRYDGRILHTLHQALGGQLTMYQVTGDPNPNNNGVFLKGWSPGEGYQVGDVVSTLVPYKNFGDLTDATLTFANSGTIKQNTVGVADGFVIKTTIPTGNYTTYTGNLIPGRINMPGGGIRVSSVTVSSDYPDRSSTTIYEYDDGVTPYEPTHSGNYVLNSGDAFADKLFKQQATNTFIDLLTLAREIPPPSVTYGTVRVKEKFVNERHETTLLNQYSEYQFQTFDPLMVETSYGITNPSGSGTFRGLNYTGIQLRNAELQNFTAMVGNLKSITLYDESTGRKLSETVNHYLTDGLGLMEGEQYEPRLESNFHSQGLVQEVFNYGKLVKSHTTSNYTAIGVVSKRSTYPSVQTGTTSTNFITGITTETKTTAFDFYSGEVVESVSKDAYGKYFLAQTEPAYSKYPDMGYKEHLQFSTTNGLRPHMITQTASQATYKIDGPDTRVKTGLVSASATTWSTGIDLTLHSGEHEGILMWKQHTSLRYTGDPTVATVSDGLLPIASYTPYTSWSTGVAQTGWQVMSEVTKSDIFSHVLEEKSISGIYSATKMTADRTTVLCTASNANYNEFAFGGAEDFGGGATIGGSAIIESTDPSQVHTGTHAVQVTNASLMYAFGYDGVVNPKRRYRASVWTTSADATVTYTVDGVTPPTPSGVTSPDRKSGAWYQIEVIIPAGTNVQVRCNGLGYFDDFRFQPVDAGTTAFVYNKWGEVSHILDGNNLYTEFTYDNEGKLTDVRKERFSSSQKRVSSTVYHYANQ